MLDRILKERPFVISYVPVRAEIDFKNLLPSLERKEMYEIRPDATLDPNDEARRAMIIGGDWPTVVLIPGRRFDATGTRHGKGVGWYDRFLAAVPAAWVRIGFCFEDQFSSEALVRESWDEPMDYVVVVPRTGEDPVLYETRARN
ncbi:MAG: 5-formyltetrahydrofolate cyclo-ligase [Patescibacteria group bacterium]